jgi:hypothetical protein
VHEAEKASGVDLTPFIIGLDEPLRAANCQFGFANFIVKPLWSNIVKICSEEKRNEILTNLNGNVSFWKDEVDKHTPPEPATEEGETKAKTKGESKDEVQDKEEAKEEAKEDAKEDAKEEAKDEAKEEAKEEAPLEN